MDSFSEMIKGLESTEKRKHLPYDDEAWLNQRLVRANDLIAAACDAEFEYDCVMNKAAPAARRLHRKMKNCAFEAIYEIALFAKRRGIDLDDAYSDFTKSNFEEPDIVRGHLRVVRER